MSLAVPADIAKLVDSVRDASASEKNMHNLALWGEAPGASFQDRGLPHKGVPFPITIEPEAPMWADILGFDLARYYQEPEEYLRRNLQMMLYRFERWDENTPLCRRVDIWLGVSFEASLLGAETVYHSRQCPWISRNTVVKGPPDLARLEPPNFRMSGLMPIAHSMYERIRELLPDDFDVGFPDWQRSPFGVCMHLRGTEEFLVDMVADANFAREQLRLVTDFRKRWVEDRAAFLGKAVEPGDLLDDEVNGKMFGQALYEEFILPTEVELGRFQGIRYWHSCADVTQFLGLIRSIPGLRLFHVGPWTDVEQAAKEMGETVALQICLNPLEDVQRPTKEHIAHRLRLIRRACAGRAFTVRADGLHVVDTLERELAAIDLWLQTALVVRDEAE